MGVLSGIGGTVNGANTVRTWNVRETANSQEYRASNTNGGTGRTDGIKDWSGEFTFYGHTPHVMPGESFTFTGMPGAGSSTVVTGTAIVDQVEISWSQEEGAIIGGTVRFSGDGAMTKGAGSASDSTVPAPPTSIDMPVYIGENELDDVRSMTLTITANNKEYASSSSGGWMKRVAGSIDASGSVEFYTDAMDDVPDANDDVILKLYVAATWWEIKWAKVTEDGPTVNMEDDGLIEASFSWSFNGFEGGVEGYINKPGGTAIWPAA